MTPEINPKHFIVNKYYKVTDIVLGRGGFSTVYLAYHLVFHNKVALKVINRNDIKEDYVTRNLQREAKILMKLNHPNIVKFYQELSQKELYCLSLEFIKGVTLSQYLKKQDSFRVSEKIAKALFYQMLSAVHHMHQNKILHRDLKQENILLEHGRVIKIVDFGLSNTFHNKAVLRTHCGSLVYAAPELFQNRSVYGTGVDLWSLGVILYTMVIGKMPFEIALDENTSSSNFRRKELFFKRISQGLTRDNWEDLQKLSKDCCNLLTNLLQPDQFKRIPVKSAIVHSWFYKDQDLKRRLPQPRSDLRQKFAVDIIEYMADKLNVSRERIQTHLQNYRFDTISSIFCILQDTLMKEFLYPPRIVDCTFLFKFEAWKRDYEARKRDDREKRKKYRSKSDTVRHPQLQGGHNFARPVFSYDPGETRHHPMAIKSKSAMDGFEKRISDRSQNLNPMGEIDYPRSRSTHKQSIFKESGYETNNTGLFESFHEISNAHLNRKSQPLNQNKSTRLDINTTRGYLMNGESVEGNIESDAVESFNHPSKLNKNKTLVKIGTTENICEKSVEYNKNSDIEANGKSSKKPLKSYKNNRPGKNVTPQNVIGGKSVERNKDSDVEEWSRCFHNPIKSNKNDRPEKNIKKEHVNYDKSTECQKERGIEEIGKSSINTPLKPYTNNRFHKNNEKEPATHIKDRGSYKYNGIDENDKNFNIALRVREKYLYSDDKLKHVNRKSLESYRTHQFSEEINNTTVNGDSNRNARRTTSAIEEYRHPRQVSLPFLEKRANRDKYLAKQSDYTTKHVKQYGDKSHFTYKPPVSVPSQNYIQRNIIVSRADRGSGRTFFNSNIPVRSSRSCITMKPEEKFRNLEVTLRNKRIYSTSYSSSIKKNQ